MPQPKMPEFYRSYLGWCSQNKNELPATRIHRQCNPKAIEVAFLQFQPSNFAEEQLQALQDWYLALGQGLEPLDATTEDTEDCLGRITVGLTRSKSLTLLVSPLNMMGLMGMAQVIATIAYGIQGLRRGETTWDWPNFNANPEQENLEQMRRWSLNTTPSWWIPPGNRQQIS